MKADSDHAPPALNRAAACAAERVRSSAIVPGCIASTGTVRADAVDFGASTASLLPGAVTAAVRVAQAAVALDGLAAPIEIEVNPSREEITAWVDAVWTANRPQLVEADIFADALDAEVIEASDP